MGDAIETGSGSLRHVMPLRCAAIALFAVAIVALTASPAYAGKGWAFKETFGSANKPEFGSDRSLTIDPSTGDLLVYDFEALTLSRWHADGTPSDFSGLGTNVIDGKRTGGTNECPTVLADCDQTPGNAGIGGFIREQVAVDNSGTATDGNIYVTSAFNGLVDVFSGTGVFLGRLTGCGSVPFGIAAGVAVDEAGGVYVGAHDKGLNKFEPSANPPVNADCMKTLLSPFFGNLAIGAGSTAGHVFAARFADVNLLKVDSALTEVEYEFGNGLGRQLAVDPATGHVFHKDADLEGVIEYDASGPTAESVTEISHLEDTGSQVHGLAVVTVDDESEEEELLYVAREGTPLVHIYKAVPTPTAALTPPPSPISGAKAMATGTVDPEGVTVTECFFEYGKTTAYGQQVPCEEYESGGVWQQLPSPADLGTGTDPIPVRGEMTDLLANGATHHYRLVAGSAVGQGKSKDQVFETADTFFTDAASGITETGATLNGTVRLEGVPLTDCRFEWGTTKEYGQSIDCVPAAGSIPNDDLDHGVTAPLSGLEPSTVYHFRLIAENALGEIVAEDRAFGTRGLPGVEAPIASALGQSTATLQAWVNPFGSATSYYFEWGTDDGYGNRVPAEGEFDAGVGDQPVLVSAELPDLEPASEYHFRVVASNSFGPTVGADHRFETLNEHGLPNNRAFELVTPIDKGTSGSLAPGFTEQLPAQAAEDGDSFIWPLQNGMPASTAGGWSRWHAERDQEQEGWLSAQLSAPALIPPPKIDGAGIANPSVVRYASDDLRCGVLQTYNPITADTPELSIELGIESLYLWRVEGGAVSYELITDRVPLNPDVNPADAPSGLYRQIEAAEDCSHVYFRSAYEWIADSSGLYEWEEMEDGKALRDAGVLPDDSVGEPLGSVGRAVAGGEVDGRGTASWNAVSPDGTRLFFTAIANEGPSAGEPTIFMRSEGGASVVEISRSETAVATNGARFEAASPDGSRVFFRANYGIADTSSSGPTDQACGPRASETIFDSAPPIEAKPCDLYEYDAGKPVGQRLSDLSADTADPQGAQIQGAVAVDEDGSHVYFAALGQLVPGKGRTYAQNAAGESANVYLARAGQPLAYVTTLRRGNGDLFFGGTMRMGAGAWTARTTPDGGRLLFESTFRLTWYDNDGGKVAYLYSADTGGIECVSCRPDGEPTLVPPGGGDPKLLSSIARSMSDDGRRVFFTSPDVLMPGAVAGEKNVYEWEEGQLYFLAIANETGQPGLLPPLAQYLGASADGGSAFLATDQQLAPQDRDFIADVYAARVDGGFEVEEEPPDCQVDESVALEPNQIYCQGERAPQPPGSNPASVDGTGKNAPGPPQCGKGKLPRGERCVSKWQLALERCRKVKTKEAKRRCVRKQLQRLERAANAKGRAAK